MIRFTKAKPGPRFCSRPRDYFLGRVVKSADQPPPASALDALYRGLNESEPRVVRFLLSLWQGQEDALTYKELREAYLRGEITAEIYERWTHDYARFVRDHLAKEWENTAKTAASDVAARYPQFLYEPSIEAAAEYIQQHSAELVTNVTEGQKQAINAAIAHFTGYTAVTPDEAAYILRPMVGLTKPQTLANARYYEHVRQSYLEAHPRCRPETARKKAADAAARYAGRQHRYRAQNIARTELAFAYNAGAYGATKDAKERGYIGECVKVWVTADDERTCPVCGELDGRKIAMDAPFSNGKLLPPAHPSCRCAVAYEEIENSSLNPLPDDGIMDIPIDREPMAALDMVINPDGDVVWIVPQS